MFLIKGSFSVINVLYCRIVHIYLLINQNSAERFIKLGANKDKVMVAGNIKFEQNPSANKNAKALLERLTVLILCFFASL
jgi:3-deoxy-D-manno-octulosonic-acid transferase